MLEERGKKNGRVQIFYDELCKEMSRKENGVFILKLLG